MPGDRTKEVPLSNCPALYSGHSFRVRAATTAHAVGVVDSIVRTLGRWESDAVLKYIWTPLQSLADLSRKLAQ